MIVVHVWEPADFAIRPQGIIDYINKYNSSDYGMNSPSDWSKHEYQRLVAAWHRTTGHSALEIKGQNDKSGYLSFWPEDCPGVVDEVEQISASMNNGSFRKLPKRKSSLFKANEILKSARAQALVSIEAVKTHTKFNYATINGVKGEFVLTHKEDIKRMKSAPDYSIPLPILGVPEVSQSAIDFIDSFSSEPVYKLLACNCSTAVGTTLLQAAQKCEAKNRWAEAKEVGKRVWGASKSVTVLSSLGVQKTETYSSRMALFNHVGVSITDTMLSFSELGGVWTPRSVLSYVKGLSSIKTKKR